MQRFETVGASSDSRLAQSHVNAPYSLLEAGIANLKTDTYMRQFTGPRLLGKERRQEMQRFETDEADAADSLVQSLRFALQY